MNFLNKRDNLTIFFSLIFVYLFISLKQTTSGYVPSLAEIVFTHNPVRIILWKKLQSSDTSIDYKLLKTADD